MTRPDPATSRIKRMIDLVGAGAALVVFSPVLAVVAVLVRLKLGSPVLFRQVRPGLHGEPFEMLKFRTMRPERPGAQGVTSDADRLVPLGRILRSTSLDELPELVNVLRGEMSLVGPRPLLMAYLDRYTPAQARRHDTRPGLTGLAQINGRNALGWDEKFAFDTGYVDTWSVRGDLRILAATVRQVVTRSGISAEGEATMPEFLGSEAPVDPLTDPNDQGAENAR